MIAYKQMLNDILTYGRQRGDRTGTGTISRFGGMYRYDFRDGFPIQTARQTSLKWIQRELEWFLKGMTNTSFLKEKGVSIWDEWAVKPEQAYNVNNINWIDASILFPEITHYGNHVYEMAWEDIERMFINVGSRVEDHLFVKPGDCGPIYGKQWRNFNGTDQIKRLVRELRENPFSRRHIVTAWNPNVLPKDSMSPEENVFEGNAALASCHAMFQYYVTELTDDDRAIYGAGPEVKYGLSCNFYQRSMDAVLGAPYNIASYSMLTVILCHMLGYVPMETIQTAGDIHIYKNHLPQIAELLERPVYDRPKLRIKEGIAPKADPADYSWDDFEIVGEYKYGEKMNFPISK